MNPATDPTPLDEDRPWRGGVGGLWDVVGPLQFQFLVDQGLQPHHRFLDIGCGCLRGGVHFIRYLHDGCYHGIDRANKHLLAGLNEELPAAGLAEKKIRLYCNAEFNFKEFRTEFDFALAQSVFSHLSWNQIQRCLVNVEQVLAPEGRFYATFFEDPDGSHKTDTIAHDPGGIVTWPDRDPFHYDFPVFESLASRVGLRVRRIGDWGHPRHQQMLVFTQ